MPSYCCFNCATIDNNDRKIDDKCSNCGLPFSFPLKQFPSKINGYKIVRSIDRGFYSATYIAEWGSLNQKRVLKISSKKIYNKFRKDFRIECEDHAKVAEDTQHLVKIHDSFSTKVSFNDIELECNVAVLDFINGISLMEVLKGKYSLDARKVAQIAIDLCSLLKELQSKGVHHNDLHPGNLIIKELVSGALRNEALCNFIVVVAIDLGSISDKSKSGTQPPRIGDVHHVATYLFELSSMLISDPTKVNDLDNRLTYLIRERAYLLLPSDENQRTQFEQFIEDIKSVFTFAISPWKDTPPKLLRFNDAYNAQVLRPWFIPYLLVDPNNKWLSKISIRGPQIITGMRGCGKTMLLSALQFHARAIPIDSSEENNKDKIILRLEEEKYLGLYVSTTKLLDTTGKSTKDINEPYTRLFLAYGLEALRAISHLRDISQNIVTPEYYKIIANALYKFVPVESLTIVGSEFELIRVLSDILYSLGKGEKEYSIKGNPSLAFNHLGETLQSCSVIWRNHYIFFLLDDVSTRYLTENNIINLLSQLMFQSAVCSFKITSESHLIEFVLKSPGNIERAREGRDFDLFDLGGEVYAQIKKEGAKFVEQILYRRAQYYSGHPKNLSPSQLLGDTSLISIAKEIVGTKRTSSKNKGIYHGISALSGVCVGDIGDMITLYDKIIGKRTNDLPISFQKQSECYQDLCASRLYDLDRKENLKDYAIKFAEASHDLLIDSAKNPNETRLRQYLSIYVRMTSGKIDSQRQKLRQLIDAGVFVYSGGSPRTKTHDRNPTLQFKLTFRKIYGISHFIGLSEQDRFELSGKTLERWLNNPNEGINILKNNKVYSEKEDYDIIVDKTSEIENVHSSQLSLFEIAENEIDDTTDIDKLKLNKLLKKSLSLVKEIKLKDISKTKIDLFIAGIGFEERTAESIKRVLNSIIPKKALLINYHNQGKVKEIFGLMKKHSIEYSTLEYKPANFDTLFKQLKNLTGNIVVDITGLAKPILFSLIRTCLILNKKLYVIHTQAKEYYPLNKDLKKVLTAIKIQDREKLLLSLDEIIKGEVKPYKIINLFSTASDYSRRRILITFASPKHERLLKLLDERDFDRIEIVVPNSPSPRSKIAKVAAEVATRRFNQAEVISFDTNDLKGILNYLIKKHYYWYVHQGLNFELALTGSKLQALACTILSAKFKINECWYVIPNEYDKERFTKGTSITSVFKIQL